MTSPNQPNPCARDRSLAPLGFRERFATITVTKTINISMSVLQPKAARWQPRIGP
jgi:hypothetical protein